MPFEATKKTNLCCYISRIVAVVANHSLDGRSLRVVFTEPCQTFLLHQSLSLSLSSLPIIITFVIITIKGISRATIYHARWERTALYSNTNNTHTNARKHARTHTNTQTHTLSHTLSHTHTHTHSLTHSHALTHTHTHTHTHARTHARTHTHTHTICNTIPTQYIYTVTITNTRKMAALTVKTRCAKKIKKNKYRRG